MKRKGMRCIIAVNENGEWVKMLWFNLRGAGRLILLLRRRGRIECEDGD